MSIFPVLNMTCSLTDEYDGYQHAPAQRRYLSPEYKMPDEIHRAFKDKPVSIWTIASQQNKCDVRIQRRRDTNTGHQRRFVHIRLMVIRTRETTSSAPTATIVNRII